MPEEELVPNERSWFDPTNWDWHQWALAAVGVYVVVSVVATGIRSVTERTTKRVRKAKRKAKKARQSVAGFRPFSFLD